MTMQPMFDPSLLETPKIKRKGGMFGGGALRGIAGVIGDVLLSRNGHAPIFAPMMMQRQQDQREDERYNRRLNDQWDMWQRQQQFRLDNPMPRQPTQTDRYVEEILNPQTDPQRRELLRGIVMNPIGMQVIGADGSQRTDYYYPGMGTPPSPAGGDDEWEYNEGGPSPLGSGGF